MRAPLETKLTTAAPNTAAVSMASEDAPTKPDPPQVACAEAKRLYEVCVKASLRSFLGGSDPQEVSCEHAADVLRVCLGHNARERNAFNARAKS